MVDGTKVRDVVAKGTFARDANAKSGWVVTVTATNEADHAESVPLETDLTRTATSIMSRTRPTPQTVWSRTETVTVPAHGTVTRRYELPAKVAAQLVEAEEHRNEGLRPNMASPIITFAVAFDRSAIARPR